MELPIEKILNSYRLEEPDKRVRKAVQASLESVVGITVPLSAISYKAGKIHVAVSPLARSQIHIKKEQILAAVRKNIDTKQVRDIR